MATAAPTFTSLMADIRKGNLKQVYLLHGSEGYYADRLAQAFAASVPEEDRDFNLTVIYGTQQLNPNDVVEAARRYPMMADRQVVILREAQTMRADQLDKLAAYVAQPNDTTVLVICFRGDKAKGKKLLEAARKSGAVNFESKPVYDDRLPEIIGQFASDFGLKIETAALQTLAAHIGCDLSKLHSAFDKLSMILPKGATVTPEAVEEHIGISRAYNLGELIKAVSVRNAGTAFDIIQYFATNQKDAPPPTISATLFYFFRDVLVVQYATDKSTDGLCRELGLRGPRMLINYVNAAKAYNVRQVIEILSAIRAFDAGSKGVGSRQNPYDLLHDLLYHIFTASGNHLL